MPTPFVQIDSFTSEPYRGNPAAVVVLPAARPDRWLQDVAREMNLAETAFLLAEGDHWRLRWLTPMVEVDLCGHATLAAAHHLWESGRLAADQPAVFATRSGELRCTREGDWIAMDFPVTPPLPVVAHERLAEWLGSEFVAVRRSIFDLLVELPDAERVRSLQPDLSGIAALGGRGVMVTARSDDPRAAFVSRFFAPLTGVPEDPVTGSAHCCLLPYWAEKLGRTRLIGYQASARGGSVDAELVGDRVILRGQAVTVLQGSILYDA